MMEIKSFLSQCKQSTDNLLDSNKDAHRQEQKRIGDVEKSLKGILSNDELKQFMKARDLSRLTIHKQGEWHVFIDDSSHVTFLRRNQPGKKWIYGLNNQRKLEATEDSSPSVKYDTVKKLLSTNPNYAKQLRKMTPESIEKRLLLSMKWVSLF